MSENIQVVLLDFGNVISKPQNQTHIDTMCHLTKLPQDRFKTLYATYRLDYDRGLFDGEGYWRRILDHTRVQANPDLIQALIHADILSWSDTDPRVIEWATGLEPQGYRIAILSNLPMDLRNHYLKHFKWMQAFDPCFFSCHLKTVKPEPEIYAHVIQTLNVAPEQILFIDDRLENTKGAQQAGLNAIHFQTFEQLPQSLAVHNIPI